MAKFNPSGSQLLYSTYLGGTGADSGEALAVDDTGAIFVGGQTFSQNFPTANPFQGQLQGPGNAFLTRLSPDGEALIYSTYLGGNSVDSVYGIAIDSWHHAYVTGLTSSTNFPTRNPVQGTLLGQLNGFVTKFSDTGTAVEYSTYLGGGGVTFPFPIALDATGAASVVGFTSSTDFPLANPIQASFQGGSTDA